MAFNFFMYRMKSEYLVYTSCVSKIDQLWYLLFFCAFMSTIYYILI